MRNMAKDVFWRGFLVCCVDYVSRETTVKNQVTLTTQLIVCDSMYDPA